MSFHYLPGPAADCSAADCSGGKQSVPSKSTTTAGESSCSDKPMDASTGFPSGTTLKLSTGDPGVDSWISSLEDSRARTSAQLARERVSKEAEADCGKSSRESLAKYDPISRSWKTRQFSLLGGLIEFSETWPRWGSMQNGALYLLPIAVPRIEGNESGYWPTPQAHDASKGDPKRVGRYGTKHGGRNLNGKAAKWPTPISRDWRSGKVSQATMERNSRPLSEQIGGSLNPMWVEWLMGFPLGWTDLEPLAMGKFQQWLEQHGSC
jgi:hypothetical protein